MHDGGERLFGSTLAQDEAPQPRGLLAAGLLLIANALIASLTAAFAPRYGLGAAWTQWTVIAIDLLLGGLLALRQERVAVVAIVRAVGGILFFTVLAIRAQSFELLAVNTALSFGLILLLAGYPKAWRVMAGVLIGAAPLLLWTVVFQRATWSAATAALQEFGDPEEAVEDGLLRRHDAAFELHLPSPGWRWRRITSEIREESRAVEAWVLHPATGAQVLVLARRGEGTFAATGLEARQHGMLRRLPRWLTRVAVDPRPRDDHAFSANPVLDSAGTALSEGAEVRLRLQLRREFETDFLLVGFAPSDRFDAAAPLLEEAIGGFHRTEEIPALRTARVASEVSAEVAPALVLVFSGMRQSAGVIVHSEGTAFTAVTVSTKFEEGEQVQVAHLVDGELTQVEGTVVAVDPATQLTGVRFTSRQVEVAALMPPGDPRPDGALLVSFFAGMPDPGVLIDPVRVDDGGERRLIVGDVFPAPGFVGAPMVRADGRIIGLGASPPDPEDAEAIPVATIAEFLRGAAAARER